MLIARRCRFFIFDFNKNIIYKCKQWEHAFIDWKYKTAAMPDDKVKFV